MKKITLIYCVVLLIGSLTSCSESSTPEALSPLINWNDEELNWHDYHDGLDELNVTGKNGILIIYADWCPTCKEYSQLFTNPDVVNSLNGLVLLRSNIDLEPEVNKQFNIDGDYVPRTFALDSHGKIINDLNSQNSKWWYYLPADDANYLIKFTQHLKQYSLAH